jgi:hypothetical protein
VVILTHDEFEAVCERLDAGALAAGLSPEQYARLHSAAFPDDFVSEQGVCLLPVYPEEPRELPRGVVRGPGRRPGDADRYRGRVERGGMRWQTPWCATPELADRKRAALLDQVEAKLAGGRVDPPGRVAPRRGPATRC